MARQIVITIPDDFDATKASVFVEQVAYQLEEGYTSGHVGVDHHWSVEGGTL